jgi:DNA polymerase sigma
MTPKDQRLLSSLACAIRREFPDAKIWAFGSRVNGCATTESDLDVCIVLERVQPPTRTRISDIAWEVGFESGIVISTIAFAREHFKSGSASANPLIKAILAKGYAA